MAESDEESNAHGLLWIIETGIVVLAIIGFCYYRDQKLRRTKLRKKQTVLPGVDAVDHPQFPAGGQMDREYHSG